MELLLAQIALRCLRNATRARSTLAWARERGDERGVASAEADLGFAGAVARATVTSLHHRHRRGEIDDMAAAQIGVQLVETLRLVATAHTSGVMVETLPTSYHPADFPGILCESTFLSPAHGQAIRPSLEMSVEPQSSAPTPTPRMPSGPFDPFGGDRRPS